MEWCGLEFSSRSSGFFVEFGVPSQFSSKFGKECDLLIPEGVEIIPNDLNDDFGRNPDGVEACEKFCDMFFL
jgi:hypothetical protein